MHEVVVERKQSGPFAFLARFLLAITVGILGGISAAAATYFLFGHAFGPSLGLAVLGSIASIFVFMFVSVKLTGRFLPN